MYMYDGPAITKAAGLIKNFLNYVLAHDACPEYAANIMAARNVCDAAPQELRAAYELLTSLPGSFNGATASLFCAREDGDGLGKQEDFDEWVISCQRSRQGQRSELKLHSKSAKANSRARRV